MIELIFSFKNNTSEYGEKLKSVFKKCRQSSFEDNLLGKNFPAAEFIQHFCAAFRLDCALCSDFLTAYGYLPLHAKNLHNLIFMKI